jgi:hypothetical protein
MLTGKVILEAGRGGEGLRVWAKAHCIALAISLVFGITACKNRGELKKNGGEGPGSSERDEMADRQQRLSRRLSESPVERAEKRQRIRDNLFDPRTAIGTCTSDGWRLSAQDSFDDRDSPLSSFTAVWGTSSDDVFAASFRPEHRSTILHFDGSQWSPMIVPQTVAIGGIWGWSPSDVYAVASTSVLHYDGVMWSVAAQMSENRGSQLRSIWGAAPDDVFAVGVPGIIAHFDGKRLRMLESGVRDVDLAVRVNQRTTSEKYRLNLKGVWGTSKSNVFAVGCKEYLTSKIGFLFHFNGVKWEHIVGQEFVNRLGGIWGTSDQDIFIVGDGIEHFDGKSWRVMPTEVDAEFGWPFAEDGQTDSRYGHGILTAIWGASPSDVFAVGAAGRSAGRPRGALILHYDGKGPWREMKAGTKKELTAVWGSGPEDVYAVGDYGTILHYEGKSCLPLRAAGE